MLVRVLILSMSITGYVQAQNPYSSSYQYLTMYETTSYGEVIKFWYADTLFGCVHSNDTISMMGGPGGPGPVFYDTVSTSASIFNVVGGTPIFTVDPIFNAPRVYFPSEATEVREAASAAGLFFDSQNGYYAHRLEFLDDQGWRMYRWEMGLPFDSLTALLCTGPPLNDEAIFVDGYLEMKGVFRGRGTVGARGHPDPEAFLGFHSIRLLDNVLYWFADPITGSFNDTTGGFEDMLTIISESNITIANTWENGRENSSRDANIVITAALAALGNDSLQHFWGSFSFEDQNEDQYTCEPWEFWNGTYVCPDPPFTDERGDIFLKGSVAQRRRGYVHRSNHGGTGYGKHYDFDRRFREQPPPHGFLARYIPAFYPPELDFGSVPVSEADTQSVLLKNEGGTYIDIENVSTGGAVFSVLPLDSTSLLPGDSVGFEVIFEPPAVSVYDDTLSIALYYGDDLVVPLSGIGAALAVDHETVIPESFHFDVFPNPFNQTATISLNLPAATEVHLRVYDTFGCRVTTLIYGYKNAGYHEVIFDGSGLASGVYIYRLQTRDYSRTQKLVLLK